MEKTHHHNFEPGRMSQCAIDAHMKQFDDLPDPRASQPPVQVTTNPPHMDDSSDGKPTDYIAANEEIAERFFTKHYGANRHDIIDGKSLSDRIGETIEDFKRGSGINGPKPREWIKAGRCVIRVSSINAVELLEQNVEVCLLGGANLLIRNADAAELLQILEGK